MIDLNSQLTFFFNQTQSVHETINQLDETKLSLNEATEWESKLKKIRQEFNNFIKLNIIEIRNLPSNDQTKLIFDNVNHSFKILTHDLEAMQLNLLFKGRGVTSPVLSYVETYSLENRVLILGCGHREDHHLHEGTYCIDNNPTMNPDAIVDITTSLMNYVPTGSFPKIVLESLPTPIFNNNKWEGVFSQLNRILEVSGKIKFNNMFGLDPKSDFGNMFNLVVSQDELLAMNGKRITECPELCAKYNEKLKNCFSKVGLRFSPDFDMTTMPSHYTIYKIDQQ